MKSAKACCWTGLRRSRFASSQRCAAAPSNFGPRMLAALSMLFMACLVRDEEPAQVTPVPAELAELHQLFVGDESQRALAAGEPHARCRASR